tara:strand:- start:483 stop:725 length:243 start_codon:yes stop_codon:yes gene_type:complete
MKIFSITLIMLIKLYQLVLSPILGNNCRYLPTCSQYFADCLKEFGLLKGCMLGTKRILSCHPIKMLGGGSGFEPVKKKRN